MNDRKRRLGYLLALVLALAAIILPYNWHTAEQDERAEDTEQAVATNAERDSAQADLIARNAELVAQLEDVTAQMEADRLAFELKVCRFGNDAKRIDRQNDQLIVEGMLAIFRASPHAAPTVQMIEQTILPKLSTEADDHDCDLDGVLDADDYP